MNKIPGQIILLLFFSVFTFTGSAKTYKIGCIEDYYPYISSNSNGELEGIIIDWWKLWSEKSGVEIEFVKLDIQSCIDQTKSGEIDAIAGLFYSEDRARYLDYSEPLMRMKTVLFVKKGLKPDSVNSISAAVNLIENSLAHSFMQSNYPSVKLNTLKSHASLIKAVYLKNIDAFIYDVPNPLGNYKEFKSANGYYMFETLFTESLRSAVKKGNRELSNLLISGATKITDEEVIEIAEKWKIFKKDRTMLRWIIGVIIALTGAIAVLFIYTFKNRKQSKLIAGFGAKTDWQVIIDKGENDLIEFKSSLRWDYRQEKVNKVLELVILKTISAFLNTEGGMLFIGVDDSGNTLGLENDYQTMSKKNSDGFLLTLTNLINQNLGKSLHKFIRINIISINEKDVCIVSVEKSDKPVFMGKNEKEEFYIRASASSQPLGLKESYTYIRSHWQK